MEEPKPLGEVMPGLSAEMLKVVDKALTKNRDERYQDAGEMIQDLIPLAKGVEKLMSDSTAKALRNSLIPPPADRDQHGAAEKYDSSFSGKNEYAPVELEPIAPKQPPLEKQRPSPPSPPPRAHASPPPVPIAMTAKRPLEPPLPFELVSEPSTPAKPTNLTGSSVTDLSTQLLMRLKSVGLERLLSTSLLTRLKSVGLERLFSTRLLTRLKSLGLRWILFGAFIFISATAFAINFFARKDIPADEGIFPVVEDAIGFWDQASSEKTVNINFNVIPPYASIFLDGERVGRQTKIPKSDDPMRLDIICDGFIPFRIMIVPDRDQDLEYTLKKISVGVQLKRE
jgi:hypothetical protein